MAFPLVPLLAEKQDGCFCHGTFNPASQLGMSMPGQTLRLQQIVPAVSGAP